MTHELKPLQLIASALIDYFRWTQLTPMILMWFGLIGMLLALFFVTNQEVGVSMTESVLEWVASLPWIGPRFVQWMEAQQTGGTLDTKSMKSTVLTAWALISVVFMLINWVASILFGPFKPWTLKIKLGLAALVSVLFAGVFSGLFYLSQEILNDPMSKVILVSMGLGIATFVVSAWCLSVAHLLDKLRDLISQGKSPG